MGEAKEKQVAAEEAAKKFREILATPLTQEEAQKMLADINVQVAQLSNLRLNLTMQVGQVDQSLAQAELEKSVIYRRVLNKPGDAPSDEAPKMAEPVGGK